MQRKQRGLLSWCARSAIRPRAVTIATVFLICPAVFGFVLGGCGGGNDETSDRVGVVVPQGNPAVRGAALGGYQSLGAGISYPFAALQRSTPTGSATGRAVNTITMSARQLATRQAVATSSDLEYNPFLNLYGSPPTVSGNTQTVTYYTDAGGTNPAGTLAVSTPGTATFSTEYATYPAKAVMVANLTGGNLPCSGTVTITYTDASGANTMSGTLDLPKNKIAVDIALTLDTSLHVGGSAIVRENGATIHLANVSGSLSSTFGGAVTVSPYGWTGQASMNLLTGAFSVMLDTGNGTTASASQGSRGELLISYPDATTESVLQPLTAALIAVAGGDGTGSDGGSTGTDRVTYLAPQSTEAVIVSAINDRGAMIATMGAGTGEQPVFFASPSSAPQPLPLPAGAEGGSAIGINGANQIVGFHKQFDSNRIQRTTTGAYWDGPSGQPIALKVPQGYADVVPVAINDRGEIVGRCYMTGVSSGEEPRAVYWASRNAEPQVLALLAGQPSCEAIGINNKGVIIGASTARAIVWTDPSAAAVALPTPSGAESATTVSGINDAGQIVGTVSEITTSGVVWAIGANGSVSLPTALSLLPGDKTCIPHGINNQGKIAGESVRNESNHHGVVWNGPAQVQSLNESNPATDVWDLQIASHINAAGIITGSGITYENGYANFVLTPRP